MVLKSQKNYYNILGITPDSSPLEVKSAYRKLARKYHPDVNKSVESNRIFKDITEAYEVLSNTQKRKQYDMLNGFYRKPDVNSYQNSQSFEKTSKDKFESKTNSNFSYRKEKVKSDADIKHDSFEHYKSDKILKDVINDILGGIKTKKSAASNPQKVSKDGEDIFADVSISLAEAVNGTSRAINVFHSELCPNCEGRKFINGSKCPACSGSGEYRQQKKITVKIPSGVKDGAKLRIANEGNPGFAGGKAGNLYIKVKIEQNSNIHVDGSDIHYRLPVSPFEAVLGAKVSIPLFGGSVSFVMPAMTNSGQKFRLAKQGLQTKEHIGDMIVTVEIQIPKDLSNDEIKLYEKLKKLSQSNIRENINHE